MPQEKPVQKEKRTQKERRAETQLAVLESACRLFGEKGYAKTSLDDIASDCGVTITPIYHYFGNKKQLFNAVTERLELELSEALRLSAESAGDFMALETWTAFLDTCKDAKFRQIILIDAPNILGRERWQDSTVVKEVKRLLKPHKLADTDAGNELIARMLLSALAEAAIMIGESGNVESFGMQAYSLLTRLLPAQSLQSKLTGNSA